MLPTLLDDRKKNALVLQRGALLRGALLCALCLAVVVGGILAAGWEIQLLRASTAQAQRSALVAAHHSSVQLVSRTLSLQSELDMQEDHDRAVLQLYLQLEREALPHLLQQLTTATAGCSDEARQRVSDATTSLRREMHAHSTQMLDKLQKVAARARARANELAADVAKQARADRQRLRAQAAAGEATWSDEELEAPLTALLRALQRPNATFELAPEVIHEWEKVAAAAVREGGEDDGLKTQMLRLAQAAGPKRLEQLHASQDKGATFEQLLQRARLHHHAPELRRALERWRAHEVPVWDVVELVEKLRAQHVFPLSMLRLHEHEWHQMVGDAWEGLSRQHGEGVAMDADN